MEYMIGQNYILTFDKGDRAKGDYIIFIGKNKDLLVDLDLFKSLYSSPNILCYQCALNFIRHFYFSGFVSFDNPNRIGVCVNNVDEVINYVNQTLLPDELKLYLAIIILRCDIDNNIYKSQNSNGAVRHLVQVLMVFGYKFNISQWQMPTINFFVSQKNLQNTHYIIDYPQLISDIGYPSGHHRKVNIGLNASPNDFTIIYNSLNQLFKVLK